MNSTPFEFFSLFASASWRVSWLIVVLVALRFLVRGRIPAQVWFAVWIVVALRLLLPFSVPAAWSPYNFAAKPATTLVEPAPVTAAIAMPVVTASSLALTTELPAVTQPEIKTPPPAAMRAAVPAPRFDRRAWMTMAWLAGAAALALVRLLAAGWFRRQLSRAVPLDEARVIDAVAAEVKQYRGRGPVACFETDAVDAPALYGMMQPRLLFPPGFIRQLDDEELRLVVRHELAHWRRRDLLAQALMQVAVTVHWFNPLVWLAARLARLDCELACDEFVLRRESHDGASAYGATLLKVLGVMRGRRRPATVVAIVEGRQQLAHRVRTIASYRGATLARVAFGVALVAVLAVASLTRESLRAAAPELAELKPAPASEKETSAAEVKTVPLYLLHAGDVIRVQVFKQPNLTSETGISADGTVSLPLIGQVEVAGRSVRDAEELVTNRYVERNLMDPKVSIVVVTYAKVAGHARFGDREIEIVSHSSVPPAADEVRPTYAKVAQALKESTAAQQRKVEEAGRALQEFKEKNPSLEQRRDVLNDALKAANADLIRATQALAAAESQINEIAEYRAKHAALTDLPFIANQPVVARLLQELANRKSEEATLATRYQERHPKMIEVTTALAQVRQQLPSAVDEACRSLEASRSAAQRNYDDAKRQFDRLTKESVAFDRLAMAYNDKMRELRTQEETLQRIVSRSEALAAENASADAEFTISVFGAVQRQGAITFGKNDQPIVLDAIARAGGFAANANRSDVRIVRVGAEGKRETLALNESEIMAGTDPRMRVQRGDVIVVPEQAAPEPKMVSLLGTVQQPGRFALPADRKLTIVELIAMGGGPSRLANLKRVTVKHTDPQTKTAVVRTIDVDALMKGDAPNGEASIEVEAGDIVFVPEKVL